MVQEVSSLKAEGLSPSDCDSDPEEKEISDDDDRNHKHRRRETQSQSPKRDPVDQVLVRPNRKRNKPFENGYPCRENDSQSCETWKRRNALASYAGAPNRANQSYSAELGPSRGMGKEFRPWIHRDPRFNSVDMTSQMVPTLPVPPNLFGGRGLPGIPNPHGSSWSSYGLMPGVLNGGLDSLHPLGLQGGLRPSISPGQNLGIMLQRCRDFEERGFCLRGDMCPMEHGINRIVVEDVQCLSQFNLPVSLPSGHPLGSSAALSSVATTSSTMVNSNNLHNRSGKSGIVDGGLSNGVSTASGSVDGSDFYDPDQPLWANNGLGTSTALQQLKSSKFDETEFSDTGIEHDDKSNTTAVGPQGTSSMMWGKVGSKNISQSKGRFSSNDQNKEKKGQSISTNFEHAAPKRKMGLQDNDASLKTQNATQPSIRKPTQRALRTLFVNGIPKKDNTIEALLSHFKKFGDVIDIYIPHTGDRAFVQFSKREEAEGALKAPDAVMGNRFIKLLWANRDRITEDVPDSANSVSHPSVAQKGKLLNAALKSSFSNSSVFPVPHADNPKPVVPNLSIAPPPSQKKPGNLALLEEFRKRQESFNLKRDALQRELAEMVKKTSGSKGEVASELVFKRKKVGAIADSAKAEAPSSCDSAGCRDELASEEEAKMQKVGVVEDSAIAEATKSGDTKMESSQAEAGEQKKNVENTEDQSTKLLTNMILHETPSLKQAIRPLAPPGAPFVLNRFKLDNRPTAFRIPAPLPNGLENVDVLKEHFSAHGEISSVEIEDGNSSDLAASSNCSALISFANRRLAERAFANGKCWQGHTLQLVWVASSNSSNHNGNKEKPSSASEVSTTISTKSGNLQTKNGNEECTEKGEDLRCSSSGES